MNQNIPETTLELIAELFYELNQMPLDKLQEIKPMWLEEIKKNDGSQNLIDYAERLIDWIIGDKVGVIRLDRMF